MAGRTKGLVAIYDLEQHFERRDDKLFVADRDVGVWIRSDLIKATTFKNLRSKRSEKTDA